MNLFTKQKQIIDIENQSMVTEGGKMQGRDKLGVWDQQIQATVYKIDKQQGATV